MTKLVYAALAGLVLLGSSSALVQAKSIKSDMSPDQLAAYCATAGAGTTTNTTVDVGGKPVSGSVHCTPADLKTAAAATDSGESEAGASEAAENGKED